MRVVLISDGVALVAGRDGHFLVNRNDLYIGKALEKYGEYSALEAQALRRLLKPGQNVVEVGANIGAHTVALARAVAPHGQVVAFEPQRACFAFLQAQIALNQLANVVALNEAVGRERGTLWLPAINYTATGNFGGISLTGTPSKGAHAVAVVTLDERLRDVPVALIKVDVEGMEEEVLRGAARLIQQHKPILYVENDRVEKSRGLLTLIFELGYRAWWHVPPLFNPDNFFKASENLYPNVASFNMICATVDMPELAGLVEIKSPDDQHPLARNRSTESAAPPQA
jgi:FkbM family methyltransferase